jgi:hypothetical protein
MRVKISSLSAVLALFIFSSCYDGNPFLSLFQKERPRIVDTYPADGSTGLGFTIAIRVSFDKPIEESSLDGNFILKDGDVPVAGTVSYDGSTKTAVFTPLDKLNYYTTYTATVTTEVRDTAGTAPAAAKSWSFTTADLKTVVAPEFSPAGGNFTVSQVVTILSKTAGATIAYTTDGSDPRTSKTAVVGEMKYVNSSMTLRAFAYKDGMYDSEVSSAVYTVIENENELPIADAGSDRKVPCGDTVILNGSKSRGSGDEPLSYSWSIVTKPYKSTAALTNATTAYPSFTPDRPGPYVVQLIVNNGASDSAPDTVTITANTSSIMWDQPDGSHSVLSPSRPPYLRAALPAGSITYDPGVGYKVVPGQVELFKKWDSAEKRWMLGTLDKTSFRECTMEYLSDVIERRISRDTPALRQENHNGWELLDLDALLNGSAYPDGIVGTIPVLSGARPKKDKESGKWGFYTTWGSKLSPPRDDIFVPYDDESYGGKPTSIAYHRTPFCDNTLWANNGGHYFFIRKHILHINPDECYIDRESRYLNEYMYISGSVDSDVTMYLRKPDGSRIRIYNDFFDGPNTFNGKLVFKYSNIDLAGDYWIEVYASKEIFSRPDTNADSSDALFAGLKIDAAASDTILHFINLSDILLIPRYIVSDDDIWDHFGLGYANDGLFHSADSPQQSNFDETPWLLYDNRDYFDYIIDPDRYKIKVDTIDNIPEF